MKKGIAYTLGLNLIAKTKIPQLFQRLAYKDEITILMYHGIIKSPCIVDDWCFVDAVSFTKQIEYVEEHFEIVSLSEAVQRMSHGEIKRPTAVITFDDGYQNSYDVAFPILFKKKIPATIFLSTGFIQTNDTVWYCRLNLALSKTCKRTIRWNGFEFNLSTSDLKAKASAEIQEKLKTMPHLQLMSELRKIIMELNGDPDCPIEIDSLYRMLSLNAITEMVTSGLIEFGAHTHRHTILSKLADEERYHEIEQSINAVYELTGRSCRCFAYPNGRMQDYDMDIIKTLKACGIQIAVTTTEGPNDMMSPKMELRRYGIDPKMSMAEFQVMVHHLSFKIKNLIGCFIENYKRKSVT